MKEAKVLIDVDGRLLCTDKRPYTQDLDAQGRRWVHPEAFETDDYGETARYKCPVCGKAFTVELPQ